MTDAGMDTLADSAGRGGTVVGMATHPLLVPGVAVGAVDADAYSAWIAVVHQVAHELDAAVIGQAEHPGPGRNHYRVRIRSASGTRTRLLLNAVGRLVAASDDPDPGELTVAFCEVPRGDLFHLAGMRVAGPEELERLLTDGQTIGLTDTERGDVVYHRPARVGDVIFNWFD